jgi:hypothetical protein
MGPKLKKKDRGERDASAKMKQRTAWRRGRVQEDQAEDSVQAWMRSLGSGLPVSAKMK